MILRTHIRDIFMYFESFIYLYRFMYLQLLIVCKVSANVHNMFCG